VDGTAFGELVGITGVAVTAVGIVRRKRSVKEPPPVPVGDTRVLDSDWLSAGARRFEDLVEQVARSADAATAAGVARQRASDPAAAMFFYQKAIDLLHTSYVLGEMADRRPSPADQPAIDRYLAMLSLIRDQRPAAPLTASVSEVTLRLRTISTACEDGGHDAARYLSALDRLAAIAPDIDVTGALLDELPRRLLPPAGVTRTAPSAPEPTATRSPR
jgi:hypothetical protein